ncbi:hypothetical protein B0T17DRAFT_622884 [Bombardia bombarda]|uniref:Uncharacterized protein n=1 Tax=Bombardia bombarda TaxID=252184 RepID=A0AA40CE26_9PEZI|nr:hypothetical protein B0T17DRAFT_622884 [Bombardia bombarda]
MDENNSLCCIPGGFFSSKNSRPRQKVLNGLIAIARRRQQKPAKQAAQKAIQKPAQKKERPVRDSSACDNCTKSKLQFRGDPPDGCQRCVNRNLDFTWTGADHRTNQVANADMGRQVDEFASICRTYTLWFQLFVLAATLQSVRTELLADFNSTFNNMLAALCGGCGELPGRIVEFYNTQLRQLFLKIDGPSLELVNKQPPGFEFRLAEKRAYMAEYANSAWPFVKDLHKVLVHYANFWDNARAAHELRQILKDSGFFNSEALPKDIATSFAQYHSQLAAIPTTRAYLHADTPTELAPLNGDQLYILRDYKSRLGVADKAPQQQPSAQQQQPPADPNAPVAPPNAPEVPPQNYYGVEQHVDGRFCFGRLSTNDHPKPPDGYSAP